MLAKHSKIIERHKVAFDKLRKITKGASALQQMGYATLAKERRKHA
jgi:hypothetical protein